MMTIFSTRRGSALLVVLGMLSFMLFSGLAFSVYMRQSRLPTSFLRRTTTTRQLAKAALAEAIEDLDQAIGNDPHPGIRSESYTEGDVGNFWSRRVFIGAGTKTNSESENGGSGSTDPDSFYPAFVDPSDTVPTLTLEGLAYLPPNLINEVRYYSRRSPTAKWHSFWFDSGRYAYSIVDVSDYFDVNRLFADRPRMACGPRRVTLAHLFEKGYDHSGPGTGAAKWDEFMEQFRAVDDDDNITFEGSKCPFVSLADFNMAWGSQSMTFGSKSIQNPFYSFVKNEGIPYQCSDAETDETADKYRMLTFVTDGWFPMPSSANSTTTLCNLEDPDYQPFKPEELQKKQTGSSGVLPYDIFKETYAGAKAKTTWLNVDGGPVLPAPTAVALWDYLDVDSVPVSLCMPTVERTPMVCGVQMPAIEEMKLEVEGEKGQDSDGGTKMIDGEKWGLCMREYTYRLKLKDLPGKLRASGLLVYPFREHGNDAYLDRQYKVDGRISFFLTREDTDVPLRMAKFAAIPTLDTIQKPEISDKVLISFPIREKTGVTPKSLVNVNEDCPCDKIELLAGDDLPAGGNPVIAKVSYTWPRYKYKADDPQAAPDDVYADPDFSKTKVYDNLEIKDVKDFDDVVTLCPLASDGSRIASADLMSALKNKNGDGLKLKANVAVWVRVRDSDDAVVDFVPACAQDDVNMLGGNMVDDIAGEIGGVAYPLLRCASTKSELTYSVKTLHGTIGEESSLGSFTIPNKKLVVSDPRYNYAPENWVQISDSSGDLTLTDWSGLAVKHAAAEDGDIFMSTSDAGYMQSIYELAFLPRMSNGFGGHDTTYDRTGRLSTSFGLSDYTTFGKEKDHGCMWRTYILFGDNDDFLGFDDQFVSGSGTKVNPYSDSKKVLMAAFANTPHDWRTAATNNLNKLFDLDTATFNGKHAWNDYSSDSTGKLCWDCLEELAEKFKAKVRSEKDWETAFANLGWENTDDKHKSLGPVTVDDEDSNIYAVDKKFFYGFWHDCFEARQQLFLVFVRAEPMMMGGGVMGQTPPQLGARAVALVWRDPAKTRSATSQSGSSRQAFAPHRTRILFYHQFD